MSILIAVLFLVGAILMQRVIVRVATRHALNEDLTKFLGKAAFIGLLVFGLVTALGTLGVDVSALVAGLGLTGFALGFALKDIISNALSGILVLLYKPFVQGDYISVTSLEGTVAEINLRYTVLTTEERRILVPNSTMFASAVIIQKKSGSDQRFSAG
jgi:small-conductance mechanosensitive channel